MVVQGDRGHTTGGGRNVCGPRGKQRHPRSRQQRAMYRRRRIVVGLAALIVLALVGWCCYSLALGIGAINEAAHHDDRYAISRSAVPQPAKVSGIKDCGAGTASLSLTAASATVPVGGSLDFTADIVHEGSGSCLIDASNASRVLTISSGKHVIWRSDVCPVDSRRLLMAKGDKDRQTITWNTDATGSTCVTDGDLPHVEAGTYVARLSLKGHPKVKSNPVTVEVQ